MSDRLVLTLDPNEEGKKSEDVLEEVVDTLKKAGITANGALKPDYDPDTDTHQESTIVVNSRVVKNK